MSAQTPRITIRLPEGRAPAEWRVGGDELLGPHRVRASERDCS